MREWRERIFSILCDNYGTSPFVLTDDTFVRCPPNRVVETQESDAVERCVEVRIRPSNPLAVTTNDHGVGNALRTFSVLIRVGYQLTWEGEVFDGFSQRSGAGDLDAIENRAELDRRRIVSAGLKLSNWSGLANAIISIVEDTGVNLIVLEDRCVLEIPATITARHTMPVS